MIPERIGHYQILRKLGEGGMGQVYLAQDLVLERKVAIKFLTQMQQASSAQSIRFLREAKAAAQLDHPFICEIHEVGDHDGAAYIVMEYVAGLSLRDRLRNGPIPLKEALRILQQVSEALEVAHGKGIVHRDLKPANIMLTPQGHAKVMDFGLAKWQETETSGPIPASGVATGDQTTAGVLLGTPAYMSPEQALGGDVDGRSDIFSLGIVLQECVTGVHPFKKASILDTISSIMRDPPPAIRAEGPGVVSVLGRIQKRSLAKNPDERYPGIQELTADLRALREHLVQNEKRRSRLMLAALSVLTASLALLLWRLSLTPGTPVELPITGVLVSDFANTTGAEVFDGVLEQSLAIGLESASFIRLLDRKSAWAAARELQPEAGQLTLELAQLVALRAGLDVVVTGEIQADRSAYRIRVWTVDPASGEKTFEFDSRGIERDKVLSEIGEMAVRVRQKLGDPTQMSAEVIQRETFTAANLEAAHSYALAQELLWAAKDAEALPLFQRAVELDPAFGRALSGIAIIYRNRGEAEKSLEYFEEALVHIDRMTPRERHRTRGNYYVMKGDIRSAAQEFQALVKRFPGDVAGYNNLGVTYFYLRDMPAALEQAARTLELDPQSVTARYNYAIFNLYAGQFEAAAVEAERLAEANASMSDLWVCKALAEAGRGNFELAVAAYDRLGGVGADGLSRAEEGLADLLLARGRLGEGIALLDGSILRDLAEDRKSAAARKLVARARAQANPGEADQAAADARRALELSQENRVQYEAAMVFLDFGRPAEAEALGERLRAQLHAGPGFYGNLILGEVRRRQQRHREALDLLQSALALEDHWLGHFHLGLLYLGAQEFTHAHAEFEHCLNRQGEAVSVFLDDLPTFRYYPPMLYYLAFAQSGLGSSAASKTRERYREISGRDHP